MILISKSFFFFFFLFVEDTVAGLPLDVERANCGGFAPNRVHPQQSFSVPENERERKQATRERENVSDFRLGASQLDQTDQIRLQCRTGLEH